MAEYYTQTYFPLAATPIEVALLLELDQYSEDADRSAVKPSPDFLREFPALDADPLSGFMSFLHERGVEHRECFSEILKTGNGETRCASEDTDLLYLTTILQRVCKSALPITFFWAAICSTSRDEDFGGGVTVIEENKIWGWSSFDALEEVRAKLKAA